MLADAHEALLAVKVDGATKEDYVWGFRVGFLTLGYRGASPAALSALEDKCAGLVRGSISNAPRVSQEILLNAYEDPNFAREKQAKYAVMKNRYLALRTCFDDTAGFSERFDRLQPTLAIFSAYDQKNVAADALRLHLIEHYDLGVIATSGLIRIAFSSVPTGSLTALVSALVRGYDDLATQSA